MEGKRRKQIIEKKRKRTTVMKRESEKKTQNTNARKENGERGVILYGPRNLSGQNK